MMPQLRSASLSMVNPPHEERVGSSKEAVTLRPQLRPSWKISGLIPFDWFLFVFLRVIKKSFLVLFFDATNIHYFLEYQ